MWKSKKLQIYVHNLYIPYMESEGNKLKYISKKETISSKQKRTNIILPGCKLKGEMLIK